MLGHIVLLSLSLLHHSCKINSTMFGNVAWLSTSVAHVLCLLSFTFFSCTFVHLLSLSFSTVVQLDSFPFPLYVAEMSIGAEPPKFVLTLNVVCGLNLLNAVVALQNSMTVVFTVAYVGD